MRAAWVFQLPTGHIDNSIISDKLTRDFLSAVLASIHEQYDIRSVTLLIGASSFLQPSLLTSSWR
jgi:hypothetical protein